MKRKDPIPKGLRPVLERPPGWQWYCCFVRPTCVYERSKIQATDEEQLKSINTLYYHCSTCQSWKPARSFYEYGKKWLTRYERDDKVMCRKCYQEGGD